MAKGKGIKPFEQHVEKLVLGVVGVVFLGVAAMQLVGGATKVSVDNQEFEPRAAMDFIARRAGALSGQINDASPEYPPTPAMALADAWRAGQASQEPLEVAQLVPGRGPGAGTREVGDEVPVTGEYMYPQLLIAGPSRPMAESFRSTLDPFEVAAKPEIREIVPVSQPFDIPAVSIEATFDAGALVATLEADPDGDGRDFSPIPTQWWRDNVEVLEVHVERADGLDEAGEPINLAIVGTLPGRQTLLELAELDGEQMTVENLNTLVGMAREEAALVREPRFYRAIAGRPWMSPSDFATLDEIEARQSEITKLVRRHEGFNENIARIEEQIRQLGGAQNVRGAAGPGSHGGVPGGRDNPRQRQRQGVVDPKLAALERRIDDQLLQQQRVKLDLEDMGVDEQGDPIVGEGGGEFIDPLLEGDKITLLAHDVNVVAGQSYIYRMRVVVNNPLFGHGQQLHEDQRQLASDATVASDWSPWSEPVEVLKDRYFFLTSASEGDMIGGPRAGIEVYQFWYGYWRRGVASLEPGDMIATELRLPDANLLPIFDMEQLAAESQPADPRDPRDPRGGHGIDLRQANPDDVIEIPDGATPAEPLPPIAVEYVLLDVSSLPGAERGDDLFQAIFRDDVGELVSRTPRLEMARALYERVKESAAEGLRQGMPEPEPEPEEVRLPPPPDRTKPPEAGGPGGG